MEECTTLQVAWRCWQQLYHTSTKLLEVLSNTNVVFFFESARANSQELFEKICEVFAKDEFPFSNLTSDLSDSAAYVHG